MNFFKSLLIVFVFSVLATISIHPVSAGGQLFHLTADTNGWKSESGYGSTVRVSLNPDFPCKGTELTFKFVEPKDGDYIATGDGNTGTYVLQEDGVNGCSTYAKMISKNSETRKVTVTGKNGDRVWESPNAPVILVDFDGQYHADNAYNGYSYRSSTDNPYGDYTVSQASPTPYPKPIGDLTVRVLSQEPAPPYGRKVVLKWSAVEGGNIYYDVYGKAASDKGWLHLMPYQGGPSATVYVTATQDYMFKVHGCIQKVGNCVASNVLLLPKTQNEDGTMFNAKPIQSVTSSPEDNQKVEELNEKVASLEEKLKKSQEKQSILEKTVQNLINLLQSVFPFLKQNSQ